LANRLTGGGKFPADTVPVMLALEQTISFEVGYGFEKGYLIFLHFLYEHPLAVARASVTSWVLGSRAGDFGNCPAPTANLGTFLRVMMTP
jgi:hypothetical protein